MGRLVYEGNTRVVFCPVIADKEAPTVAEIAAGTNLTPYITKDGVAVPNNQNMVDNAGIEEVFDAQEVGSWGGGPVELTMFRDDDEDTAYDLIQYRTRGFLVISRFRNAALVAGDKVEVWPVSMHEPVPMASAGNEMQKFTAAFAVTSAPAMRAEVVAGAG